MRQLGDLRVTDVDVWNYVTWKRERSSWLERAAEGEDFYYLDREGTGTMLTVEQKNTIEDTSNVILDINFIHPVGQQRTAILTQNKHAFKIISLDGRMKDYATVLDKMKNGVFYHSKLQLQMQQFIKDIHVSGMGCMYVDHSERYYPGQFGVTIRNIPFDSVILDCNTRDATTSDAEGIILEKEITEAKAIAMFKDVIADIDGGGGEPVSIKAFAGGTWIQTELTDKAKVSTWVNAPGWKYHYRVFYDKVYTTMYLVKNPQTDEVEQLFKENLSEDEQILLDANEGEIPDFYVRKRVALGDFFIYTEVMPITNYPIIFGWYDWAGRPYRSYGMVHYLKGMQQAYNKLVQLAVLNGILQNNGGWISPKGGIAPEDKEKWRLHGNNPMHIKEYVPISGADGKTYIPERVQVQGLSNFYPTIMQLLQQGIEYVSGINPVVQGNADAAGVDVFSSLQQYQNAAMQRIIMTAQGIAASMEMLGNVTVEFLISTLKKGDYVFFDENGTVNEVQIADDINNFKLNKFLVVSIPSTMMPTQRLSFATELMKVAQSDPDPVNRSILTKHAMKLSEIPEGDEIMEETDMIKRTQGELQQAQEALKRANEVAKQMENRAVNAEIELKVEQGVRQGLVKTARMMGQAETEIAVAKELETGKMQESQS
jgi:hypothetical protein